MITCRDLEKRTNEELLSMYHSETDGMKKQIGDLIVERNMGLVNYVAEKFKAKNHDPATDREDVAQAGVIGLIEARERYNPIWGVRFSTFAVKTMWGIIRNHLRSSGRIGASAYNRLSSYCSRLESERVSPGYVAQEERQDMENALAIQCAISIDAKNDRDTALKDLLPDRLEPYEQADLNLNLERVLGTLEEKSRTVLTLYYIDGLSREKIGHIIGHSPASVTNLLVKARKEFRLRSREMGIMTSADILYG